MELTALPLSPEIWAATPCAARALIVALQERIRELEARFAVQQADVVNISARTAQRTAGLPRGS